MLKAQMERKEKLTLDCSLPYEVPRVRLHQVMEGRGEETVLPCMQKRSIEPVQEVTIRPLHVSVFRERILLDEIIRKQKELETQKQRKSKVDKRILLGNKFSEFNRQHLPVPEKKETKREVSLDCLCRNPVLRTPYIEYTQSQKFRKSSKNS